MKNKSYAPQRTALVDFYFQRLGDIGPGSYDVAQDIMLAAMELDIIRRGGSTYRFNDEKWTGKESVLARCARTSACAGWSTARRWRPPA